MGMCTQVIGSPQDDELGFITSEKAKRYIRSLPRNERVDFGKLWPHANKMAVDLIDKMLVFDPTKRITVRRGMDGLVHVSMLHHSSTAALYRRFVRMCRSGSL